MAFALASIKLNNISMGKTKLITIYSVLVLILISCGNETKYKNRVTQSSEESIFSSISPTSGDTAGGTSVTIEGLDFTNGTTVEFGALLCTNIIIASSTQLTCDTPANTSGSVTVVVTNEDGTIATAVDAFSYGSVAPSFISIDPNSFINTQSTNLTINGAGFVDGLIVVIGGLNCTSISVNSASQLTCMSPTGLGEGSFDLVITNPDLQEVTKASAFAFRTPPTFTELNGSGAKGIFGNNCASCHGAFGGLTVSDYSSVSSRVSAGSPNTSLIWQRMNGIGSIMPLSGALPDSEIQHVTDWILDGAQNN